MLIAYAAYSNPTLNISELHQLIDSGVIICFVFGLLDGFKD
jgi:hypothetical protein